MKYELYKDESDEWRWRLVASNGKCIADSAEGYHNRQDCLDGIMLVKSSTDTYIHER